MERDFFMVKSGCESHAKITGFIARRQQAHKLRLDVAKKYGAIGLYGNDQRLVGLIFESDVVPDGFVRANGNKENLFIPNTKSKAGRALKNEFHLPELVMPGAMEFHVLFDEDSFWTGEPLKGRGFPMLFILFETSGADFILTVPQEGSPKDWQPPADCAPLKKSEYWRMKEEKADKKP